MVGLVAVVDIRVRCVERCEGGVGEVHLWSGVVDNKVFNMSDTSTYIRLAVIKVWLVIACCRLLDSRVR